MELTNNTNKKNTHKYFIKELELFHKNLIQLFHEYSFYTKVLIDCKNWEDNYLSLDDYIEEAFVETIGTTVMNYISQLDESINGDYYKTKLQSSLNMRSYINLITHKLLYMTNKFDTEKFRNEYSFCSIESDNIQTKKDLDKNFIELIKNELYKTKNRAIQFSLKDQELESEVI